MAHTSRQIKKDWTNKTSDQQTTSILFIQKQKKQTKMRNFKPDFQVIKTAASFLFYKGIVCVIAFLVWHFTLGLVYPIAGDIIGVIAALIALIMMLHFEQERNQFEDLSEEEARRLRNEILWQATFRSGKKLSKAYTTCNLTRAIDAEFIHPTTGEKYRLIFRRTRNGERMQTPNMREPLPPAKETEENIYVETDGDWPGQYQTEEIKQEEDKPTFEEAAKADERIYT